MHYLTIRIKISLYFVGFLSHSFSFFFFSVQHFETTTNKSVCHFALKVNIVICQTNTPPMLIIKATVVIFYFIMVTIVVGLVFSDHYSSFSRQTHILHTSLGTQFAVSADFTITSSANGNFSSTNMLHVYRARFFFFQHRRTRQCKYNIPVLKWLKKQKNRTKNKIKYLRLWFGSAENSQLYQIGWMKKTGFALNGWNELFFQLIKVIEKCIGNYIGFFFSQGMVMGKLRRIQF